MATVAATSEQAPRTTVPGLTTLLLIRPRVVAERLAELRGAGVTTPNLWQLQLGVLRMWHRIFFRPDSIGTCTSDPIRPTWRARLLHYRPLRFPFLLKERAVAPWDLSGLLSDPRRVLSHLLGAHHDQGQFAYDLEMISFRPGALEEVRREAQRVIDEDTPRSRWLQDLVVYERYHERLRDAVERAMQGDIGLTPEDRNNPDISFHAYLRWCAAQPETPEATLRAWREGRYSIEHGLTH
jgi:hypothetical protein